MVGAIEVEKPALQPTEDEDHDEDTTMVGAIEVEKPALQPTEDEEDYDEDTTMVGVRSRESSPNPQEVEDVRNSMVGVESDDPLGPLSDSSDSEEDGEGDQPSARVNLLLSSADRNVEGDPMVGVESMEQASESKGPSSDSSESSDSEDDGGKALAKGGEGDSMVGVELDDPLGLLSDLTDSEEDNEEVRPTNTVESLDSSEKEKTAAPATPKTSLKSNQNIESSLHLVAQVEPRRSSRTKNKPTFSFVNYAEPRKSSAGGKKPVYEKEDILLQASLLNYSNEQAE
jgi:hypothetical protein